MIAPTSSALEFTPTKPICQATIILGHGISTYEETDTKEMPKQAACAAIISSDSCGYSFGAEGDGQIHFFVTCDENGLVGSYRVEYGDTPIYDGDVEISFEDLYERAENDWKEIYRAEIPGTMEYLHKQEADALAQEAGETWMDVEQREPFRQICNLFDEIKNYELDVINAAREYKKCFNSAQYEQPEEGGTMRKAAGDYDCRNASGGGR